MPTTAEDRVSIRRLTAADGPGCDAVIASLAYHFGNQRGIVECAQAVRSQEGHVALMDGQVVGFLTLQEHFPGAAEITWMGVHAEHRRRGIGRRLIERAAATMADRGGRFLFVLTLGPSVPEDVEDGHQGTRRFYEAVGFTPLREFGLRSWDHEAALVLVRAVAANDS